MGNAPVYYIVVQVRFNPILALDPHIPTIQEDLRKAGYPDFEKRAVVVFDLAHGGGESSTVQQVSKTNFFFSNMETTRGFVLGQNSLAMHTTEYDVFETFSAEFLRVLELLHRIVQLSYSERVGVRYLDAVIPKPSEDLEDYLVPQMLGLYKKLEGDLVHTFCETMTRSKVGTMMSRVVIQDAPLGFPPDLQPVALVLGQRFKTAGVHAMLDTDGFFDGREKFDSAALKARLFALHDEIVKSFNATVTPHALSAWK